jgi:hypothetical protein
MSFGDKEIRNIEIEKVMIECKSKCFNIMKAVFDSVDDRQLTDIVNENMKSIFSLEKQRVLMSTLRKTISL